MDRTLRNIGDRLFISIVPKHKGTAILTNFTDEWIGEGYLLREFRFIYEDLFKTEWQNLTNENLANKKLEQSTIIEVRYTLNSEGEMVFGNASFDTDIELDATAILTLVKIEFNGDFQEDNIYSPTLSNSIFGNIAWSEEVNFLTANLFRKLYFRGILPKYIVRGENIDREEDMDFISLFSSVARFFAIIIHFFKRFENFSADKELMREWVKQNGIYFNESEITLEQLQTLGSCLLDEIRKRGTKMIFKREGDEVNNENLVIDGEFIRLTQNKEYNELSYEMIPQRKIGWCMNQSSPLYRGAASDTLNKTVNDFSKLEEYTIFSNGNSSVSAFNDDENLRLLSNGSECGLGRIDGDIDSVISNYYAVDPNMDYEISFSMKVISASDGKIRFGVEGFDKRKQKLTDATILPNNYEVTENFLGNGIDLDKFVIDKWYNIRGIIHAYSTAIIENLPLNIGFGNSLTFNNRFLSYILPKIYIDGQNSEILIKDYKIKPLVRGTNILPLKNGKINSHSLGFIQSPRIFYIYVKNNNNNISEEEMTEIIERYLLPFDITDIIQYIHDDN